MALDDSSGPRREPAPQAIPPEAAAFVLEEITERSALEALRDEWSQLCDRSSCTPFQRPGWLLPWHKHFETGDLWVLTVRQGERLVGIAPFFIETMAATDMYDEADAMLEGLEETVLASVMNNLEPPSLVCHLALLTQALLVQMMAALRQASDSGPRERVLRLMGADKSDYLDVVVEPRLQSEAMARIWDRLMAANERWDRCEFENLREQSPLLTEFELAADLAEERLTVEACPRLALPATREELQNIIRARQLKNLKQSRRRLERLGTVRFSVATQEDGDVALDELVQLHTARWNENLLPGVLTDPNKVAFHREVIPDLAARDALALYRLHLDEQVIAVFYGFFEKDECFFYLHGFDPAYAKYSPGVWIVGAAIEVAVERGATVFDFLRGEEAYKYRWGAVDEPGVLRRFRRHDKEG